MTQMIVLVRLNYMPAIKMLVNEVKKGGTLSCPTPVRRAIRGLTHQADAFELEKSPSTTRFGL